MIFSAQVAHYKSPLFFLGVFLVFFLDFGALRWSIIKYNPTNTVKIVHCAIVHCENRLSTASLASSSIPRFCSWILNHQ